MRPWLTVDSDDLRHLPKFQGHPRRSKPIAQERISSIFQLGMQRFSEWLDTHNFPVTMFVIADQLEVRNLLNVAQGANQKTPTSNDWMSWFFASILVCLETRSGTLFISIGACYNEVERFRRASMETIFQSTGRLCCIMDGAGYRRTWIHNRTVR